MAEDILNEFHRYLSGDTEHRHEKEILGFEAKGFTRSHEIITAQYLLLFVTLLCLSLVLQFYVGKVWHFHYLPESGATVFLGMVIGGLIRLSGKDSSDTLLGFDATVFFLGFLPPIIFNSGYQINRRLFFKNMGGILVLSVVGTALSTVIVGVGLYYLGQANLAPDFTAIEYLTFGSLISATDPVSTLAVFSELKVHPTLFYLVFGESVLNDAVSITLFKTMSKYIGQEVTYIDGFVALLDFAISCVGSTIIGLVLGMFFAWIFKVVDMTKHRLLLVSLFTGMIYAPFLLSETLQLSGILTLLFSAITARRYISHNIPPEAQRACAFVFELMAYLAETGVFLYLGLDVFSKNITKGYEARLIFWSLLLCFIGRAAAVYPGLNMINSYRQSVADKKNSFDANLISPGMIHMIWFSGLRGAVAYASANLYPDYTGSKSAIAATTTAIILFTLYVHGGLTVQMCEWLKISTGVDAAVMSAKMGKVKTSSIVNWEHKYIYPLVIKGYEDPDLDPHYKPRGDKIDADLGRTIHDIEVNKRRMELELKNLQVAEARARMLLMQSIDEENPADAETEKDGSDIRPGATEASETVVDFAVGYQPLTPVEDAPWRYAQLDTDIIDAPRSYSMPTFNLKDSKALEKIIAKKKNPSHDKESRL